MDFSYSQDQFLMYDSVMGVLQQVAGPLVAREAYDAGSPVARRIQAKLGDQGILGGPIAQAYGGSEFSMVDYALIFEAAGQKLLPFPLVETYMAAQLLQQYGDEDQRQRFLPGIAGGETLVTMAWGGPGASWSTCGVQVVEEHGCSCLYGRRTFVPFADEADIIVVPAVSNTLNGSVLALVNPRHPGVTIRRLESLDGSYPLCSVELHGYALPRGDQIWEGEVAWENAVVMGQVALAQEALGVAEEVFHNTVEYLKVREQFGSPVGRFQAVKHAAADDYLLLESARVANRYAAWLAAEQSDDAPLYAAMANAYASEMARRVSGDAIQLHGGIGFTWDSDVHLYFKRAWRIAAELGRPTDLREAMARQVIDQHGH